jgi:hypothetical protein
LQVEDTENNEFDMEEALGTVSAGLGLGEPEEVDEITEIEAPEIPAEETETPETEVVTRAAPKAWAKEQHETWGKLPKEAQDYIEHREKQMLDGITEYKQHADFGRIIDSTVKPFEPMFQQAGIDVPTGIKYLLNAQNLLQNGSMEQKTRELQRIAQQFGVNLGGTQEVETIDPNVKALKDQIEQIQSGLTQREQAELQARQTQTLTEVEAFAADPANAYFDEVADDIVTLIKAGKPLKEAYEKAVWANPVTRQKEIDRLNKENVTKLREKAKQESDAARKATGSNVRTRDTTKSPTEPKGKLFGEEHQAEMLAIVNKGKV